ncbi:MAG: hypothetical protein PHS53_01425 [Candidatus Pacebacteria bacterium]|nr:hypothetical protein [Candidatus Paceibacterota bacterium]MDD5356792.1 hypothetical protein [Candidatus Paceibacterota bacterium]
MLSIRGLMGLMVCIDSTNGPVPSRSLTKAEARYVLALLRKKVVDWDYYEHHVSDSVRQMFFGIGDRTFFGIRLKDDVTRMSKSIVDVSYIRHALFVATHDHVSRTNGSNGRELHDALHRKKMWAAHSSKVSFQGEETLTFHDVEPVNSVRQGLVYLTDWDNTGGVQDIDLVRVHKKKKTVHVVFTRDVDLHETEYVQIMRAQNLKPCVNGANYLLGLMRSLHGSELGIILPERFGAAYIIAAEPDNPNSVWFCDKGYACHLSVSVSPTFRYLGLSSLHGTSEREMFKVKGAKPSVRAFLAEGA